MVAALLVASLVAAPELEELLARGPVVAVQTDEKGKFEAAVGQVEVLAPIDKVWAAVSGFAHYKEFMPRVVESRVEGMASHTDMGLLVNAGIPTVNFGPGAPSVAHQPDEHVAERDLRQATLTLALAIAAWCGWERDAS